MKYLNISLDVSIVMSIIIILVLLLPIRHVHAKCSNSKWMCDDGFSCINIYDKCDGKLHCPDGSDEIAANCFNTTQCPEYSFQCSYGGCIAGKRECDDHQDCADNSDELLCDKNKLIDLQQNCRTSGEMQCLTSEECIAVTDVCDGHANCADASDESVAVCGTQQSCGKGFRCAYGACVSGRARCNGTKECYDGSDEAWEMCKYPRKFTPLTTVVVTTLKPPTTIEFPSRMAPLPEGLPCEIPKDLSGVNIKTLGTEMHLSPGSMVDDDVTVLAECVAKKDTAKDLFCQDGKWFGEFPKCSAYCSVSELEGISTTHKCTLYGTEDDNLCLGSVVANTTITFHCAYGYIKTKVSSSQEITCLPDGRYDKRRRLCKQNCGILSGALDKLTKNAYPIKPSRSPWHVAIFRNDGGEQKHICGGSIISPRLIVSAAHCFWNISERTSPHLYRIGAGKLTNRYLGDESEGSPQIREVEQIYISDDYNDETDNYYADIAILKLKQSLKYNVNVSSVCVYERKYDSRDNVGSGILGSITGYERTTGLLERISMVTISSDECGILPGGKSLATDKFCLNNPNLNSTLCKGDSGGGFVEHINGAFHLLGIVSSTPVTQNDCVSAAFVGMSNMRYIRPALYAIMMKELENDKKLF